MDLDADDNIPHGGPKAAAAGADAAAWQQFVEYAGRAADEENAGTRDAPRG